MMGIAHLLQVCERDFDELALASGIHRNEKGRVAEHECHE